MIGNILIISISIIIIGSNIYVFKYIKNPTKASKKVSAGLLIIWILSTLLPNIPLLLKPLTEPIQGRILDENTKKSIANANIKVAWYGGTHIIEAGSTPAYKVYSTISNERGEFSIPSAYKPFSVYLLPILIRKYEGMQIVVYHYDYYIKKLGLGSYYKEIGSNIQIDMIPANDDKKFLKNLQDLPLTLNFMDPSWNININNRNRREKEFIINVHRMFDKKFPNSALGEENLFMLSSYYGWLGDHSAKFNVLQEMIKKYPSGENVEFAKNEMEWLKRFHKIKTDCETGGTHDK